MMVLVVWFLRQMDGLRQYEIIKSLKSFTANLDLYQLSIQIAISLPLLCSKGDSFGLYINEPSLKI